MKSFTEAKKTIVRRLLSNKVLSADVPFVSVMMMDHFKENCDSLIGATRRFPDVLHCFAVKANPIGSVLKHATDNGLGLECASMTELLLSLKTGCPAKNIIFDAPLKTAKDLRFLLEHGVNFNIDNFQELDVLVALLADSSNLEKTRGDIGLRVNPGTIAGEINLTATGTNSSKFGILLSEPNRRQIMKLFQKHKFLSGVHVHVGSQGLRIEDLVQAVTLIDSLTSEIETISPGQIRFIDIGGGMSLNYESDAQTPFETYFCQLESLRCMHKYKILTEFGRRLISNSGVFVSKAEYIKQGGHSVPTSIVVNHIGAHLMVRAAHLPEEWRLHRFDVFDSQGYLKASEHSQHEIVGPLCFSGDIIFKGLLPRVEQGDYLMAHDTGGYTTSLYCAQTSQPMPPVYDINIYKDQEPVLLHPGLTVEQLTNIWMPLIKNF